MPWWLAIGDGLTPRRCLARMMRTRIERSITRPKLTPADLVAWDCLTVFGIRPVELQGLQLAATASAARKDEAIKRIAPYLTPPRSPPAPAQAPLQSHPPPAGWHPPAARPAPAGRPARSRPPASGAVATSQAGLQRRCSAGWRGRAGEPFRRWAHLPDALQPLSFRRLGSAPQPPGHR